jgi:uncharacterized protein
VAALIALWPATAYAHVTVNPSEAEQGGFEKLTFRVPNERPDAGTTKVQVTIPDDVAIQHVSVQPVPGWTYTIENRDLAEPIETDDGEVTSVVSSITWTGGEIKPGEFQEFPVSVGPLPEVEQVEFRAIQTYSSGEEVRWIETQTEGGPEPEFPAPVLTLAAASGDSHGGGSDDAGEDATDDGSTGEAAADTDSDDDSSSDTLAIIALVVGGLGLIVGGAALVRARAN